jgi:opacity protein-like surface antigen
MVRFGSRTVAAIAALALAALMAEARAQLYIAGNFGVEFLNDSDISSSGTGTNGSGEISYGKGVGFSGALGMALGRIRVEGEAFYRVADLDTLTVSTSGMRIGTTTVTAGTLTANGDTTAYGVLGNVYYDIYTGTAWVPYLGIGFGGAHLQLNINSLGATAISFDETDWVLAYQGSAGLAYQISSAFAFTMGYRYFATTDTTYSVSGTENEFEMSAHIFHAGLRYKF